MKDEQLGKHMAAPAIETEQNHFDIVLPVIDHPAQDTWDVASSARMYEQNINALRMRFAGTNEDVDALVNVIEHANSETQHYRKDHENKNIDKLRLSPGERALYKELAGHSERAGEMVYLFGALALRSASKVVGELGGKHQFGDWECTGALDGMVKDLPRQLDDIDPRTEVEILEDNTGLYLANNYFFRPIFREQDGIALDHSFRYGILRRRRPVANITLSFGETVKLYKQSNAVVLVNYLPAESSRIILAEYADLDPARYAYLQGTSNTEGAIEAGLGFERARSEEQGVTLDIMPISAHYLMIARDAGKLILRASL